MRRSTLSRSAIRVALALSLALLLGLPHALLAAEGGDGIQRALAAQERVNAQLLGAPGIAGTGIGINAAGKPIINVYVVHGAVDGVPRTANGVAVQRVVTGLISARACQDELDPTRRCERPVPIGVSVGHPNITAGTIAARVVDGNGNVFALSNNHVLANSNNASIGDPALQPGPYDGGTSADSIGTLAAFKTISFNYSQCDGSPTNTNCNTIDAAIALTSTANLGTATLPLDNSYGVPKKTTATVALNQAVKKCGRTTGCTSGNVAEVSVTIDVCFKPRGMFFCASDGIARFVDQIGISPGTFSAGGDSGSLIVNANSNPVGLLFAGSSTRTFANKIGYVLNEFKVNIDDRTVATDPPGGEEPPPDATAPQDLTATVRPQGNVRVDLSWTGGAATVDIWRSQNGGAQNLLATTSNSGSYRDHLGRNSSGDYTYRVCNAGTNNCAQTAATVP
jgi:hypothetical protein